MMKSIYIFFLIAGVTSGFVLPDTRLRDGGANGIGNPDEAPKVKIEIPGNPEHLNWKTTVRYAISVADPKDGESKYGEIDARTVLLDVEYFDANEDMEATQLLKEAQTKEEHAGLSLMKRSTCFGCHSDKTRLAGPSFAEISGRYEKNSNTLKTLATHIIEGSTGIWGTQIMPSHPDLSQEKAAQIAEYILEQGANKNRWIFPGLEGAFQTIEKPKDHQQGIYILTASYTSTSGITGRHAVVYKIK